DSVPPGGSGGSVWSALSIDPARNQLFLGVGQNLTQPATAFSDAIVAINLDTGAVNWSFQATAGDAWHAGQTWPRPPLRQLGLKPTGFSGCKPAYLMGCHSLKIL
ncbi:MAG: hypothetical protein V3S24_00450, partial [Candidatus Tectomicrobia bacterium]